MQSAQNKAWWWPVIRPASDVDKQMGQENKNKNKMTFELS